MAQNYELTMKQGDLGPAVRARIVNDSDQQSPDYSAAVATFKLLRVDTEGLLVEIFNSPAVIENPTTSSGTVRYDWSSGDTDLIGRFQGVFKIVLPGAIPEHYPDQGYIWVNIESAGPNP